MLHNLMLRYIAMPISEEAPHAIRAPNGGVVDLARACLAVVEMGHVVMGHELRSRRAQELMQQTQAYGVIVPSRGLRSNASRCLNAAGRCFMLVVREHVQEALAA